VLKNRIMVMAVTAAAFTALSMTPAALASGKGKGHNGGGDTAIAEGGDGGDGGIGGEACVVAICGEDANVDLLEHQDGDETDGFNGNGNGGDGGDAAAIND
jgi:hypothetical protein